MLNIMTMMFQFKYCHYVTVRHCQSLLAYWFILNWPDTHSDSKTALQLVIGCTGII